MALATLVPATLCVPPCQAMVLPWQRWECVDTSGHVWRSTVEKTFVQVNSCVDAEEHQPRLIHSASAPGCLGPANYNLEYSGLSGRGACALLKLNAEETVDDSPTTASEGGTTASAIASAKLSKTALRNRRNRAKVKRSDGVKAERVESPQMELQSTGRVVDVGEQKAFSSQEVVFCQPAKPGQANNGNETAPARPRAKALAPQKKGDAAEERTSKPVQTGPTREQRHEMRDQMLELCRDVQRNATIHAGRKSPVGVLSVEELSKYGVCSDRRLVSVYGFIFDVTDCVDEFNPTGFRAYSLGKDISWDLLSTSSTIENCNQFYDAFKADDIVHVLQRLCAQIVRFEFAYGPAVGRLSAFDHEDALPALPLEVGAACTVM